MNVFPSAGKRAGHHDEIPVLALRIPAEGIANDRPLDDPELVGDLRFRRVGSHVAARCELLQIDFGASG